MADSIEGKGTKPQLELHRGGMGFWWVSAGDAPHPMMYGPFVDQDQALMARRIIRMGMGDREPGDIEECVVALIRLLGGGGD